MKKLKNAFRNNVKRAFLFIYNMCYRISLPFRASIAIDVNSLNNIRPYSPLEILSFYRKSNILLYNSMSSKYNPPTVLTRGIFSVKPTFIDFNKLNAKQKETIFNKLSKVT